MDFEWNVFSGHAAVGNRLIAVVFFWTRKEMLLIPPASPLHLVEAR